MSRRTCSHLGVLGKERRRKKGKRTRRNKGRKERRTWEIFPAPDTLPSQTVIWIQFSKQLCEVWTVAVSMLQINGNDWYCIPELATSKSHALNPLTYLAATRYIPQPQFSFWRYSIFDSEIRNKSKIFRGLKRREKCLLLSFHFMFIGLHF